MLQRMLAERHPRERARALRYLAILNGVPFEEVYMLCRPVRAEGGGLSLPAVDEKTAKDFPCLVEYLGQATWEDGSVREVSTVLCVMEDGVFKACLIDKATDRTLWVSCPQLGKLLHVLEAKLLNPSAEWRKRRPETPQKRR